MTLSRVDWTVLWKIEHVKFFWTYLALGIPLKLLPAWRLETGSTVKGSAFAILSSFATSAVNTYLPILPVACGLALNGLFGDAGQLFYVELLLVAVSMGVEATFTDMVLVRVLMTKAVEGRLLWVLLANILIASIALAIILVWLDRHPIALTAKLELQRIQKMVWT